MIQSISYGTFLFFGSMTVIASIFVYIWVPETKGVSLEDMDILWEETTGFAREKRKQYEEILAIKNTERINRAEKEQVMHVE
jgi:hypothetical protein